MDQRRILVVDDDEHSRGLIVATLEQSTLFSGVALQVEGAGDGEQALRLFRRNPPDLLVTDLQMPIMDGIELVQMVRAKVPAQQLPILVITGVYAEEGDELQALQRDHGVNVLIKPFSLGQVVKTAHKLLSDAGRLTSTQLVDEDAPGSRADTIRGSLEQTPLAQVLLDGLDRHLMGTIDLQQEKVRKRIFVVMGHPVFISSNVRGETLGMMLVASGRLSRDEHHRVLEAMDQLRLQYGEVLVHLGLMDEAEVSDQLAAQLRDKLEAALHWRDGSWELAEDHDAVTSVPRYPMDVVQLLFEGLPRCMELEQVVARLSHRSEHHNLELLPRGVLLRKRFDEYHGPALMEAVEAGRSVAEILASIELRAAVEQIHVLLECSMVKLVRRQRPSEAFPVSASDMLTLEQLATHAPPPGAKASTGEVSSSEAVWRPVFRRGEAASSSDTEEVQPVKTSDRDEALRVLRVTYLGLHVQSHYEVLDVAADSPVDVIEVAYNIKCKSFSPARYRLLDLGPEAAHLEEVRKRLDLAFAQLSDAAARQEYDERQQDADATSEWRAVSRAEESFQTGEQLSAQGRHAEAGDAFAKAREFDDQPEYRAMEAWSRFNASDRGTGAAAAALTDVKLLLASAPGMPAIHMVAAWLYRAREDVDQAAAQYRAALQINPAQRKPFNELERLLLNAGRIEQLEEQYRRTLYLLDNRDPPWAAELWKRLTLLYQRRLKDRKKARTAATAATNLGSVDLELELFPDDDEFGGFD